MQKVYSAKNMGELQEFAQSINSQKVFVVSGNNSYIKSGAKDFVDDLFKSKELTSFRDFAVNPQLSDVKKGIEIFQKGNYELIVAVGGGSALDMAKLISVFAHQNSKLEDLVLGKDKIAEKATPVLAIPTTAGTGAEATHFAVVYIDKTKYSVAHNTLLPKYVYLSSDFSMSASNYLTACTGLDAFCQAVESVWSVNANQESMKYGLEAIELCWNNLTAAVNINSAQAKEKMQMASYLAGRAINITKTTAPHAFSYAFTSYYNIPHGHAVALTLPFFLQYNYSVSNSDCTDERGAKAVKGRIDLILSSIKANIDNSSQVLEAFFAGIGINININTLIKEFDANLVLNNVNVERLGNNPRQVSQELIAEYLKK